MGALGNLTPRLRGSFWTPMCEADLPAVNSLSSRLHPRHPERDEIFIERFRLFPAGAFVFWGAGDVRGYCISYPWLPRRVTPLDTLIGAIPKDACVLYLHDVGVEPNARCANAIPDLFRRLIGLAKEHNLVSITGVAVNGTERFWRRFGSEPDLSLDACDASYGDASQYMSVPIARLSEQLASH